MASGGSRAVAALLAVLLIAALGWWLAGSGGAAGPAGAARPDGVSPRETHPSGAPDAEPAPRTGGKGTPRAARPGDEPPPEKVAPPERWIEGTCVLEDGTPLAGARVGSLERIRIGVPAQPGEGMSVVDGTFRVRVDPDPIPVRHPSAVLVAAEGGEILPFDEARDAGRSVRLAGGNVSTLRLVFRDRAGYAFVRLVNADTNEPVTVVKGLRIVWLIAGGTLSMGHPEDPGLGGWIQVPEGRLPEYGRPEDPAVRADLSKVEVEFRVPGFEAARLALKEIHGRMQVTVRPVPPDATGTLVVPLTIERIEGEYPHVTATLRWTGPDPAPRSAEVLGLPIQDGPFALFDLPDRSWMIEVAATLPDNTVVRGKRAFEKHGATVDLGSIDLVPAGKVTIRVLDSADQPIPQAWAVIVRPEENPDQGRRLDLNEKGMVSVGDLEPGVGHRAVVKGLPRDMEQTVVASADGKPVDFKWSEKLVPCRITLSVDGKAVANADGRTTIPAVIQDSPLPRDKGAWKSDGTFEAKLVPGTYKFSALATPKEGGDLALFSGEVTVLTGDAFEARLELTRGNR